MHNTHTHTHTHTLRMGTEEQRLAHEPWEEPCGRFLMFIQLRLAADTWLISLIDCIQCIRTEKKSTEMTTFFFLVLLYLFNHHFCVCCIIIFYCVAIGD